MLDMTLEEKQSLRRQLDDVNRDILRELSRSPQRHNVITALHEERTQLEVEIALAQDEALQPGYEGEEL